MSKLTQKEVALHLGLSGRRVRDVLAALGVDHRTHSLDQIRTAYIDDLRQKAAGRSNEDLGEARRQETVASTHLKVLDIFEKHKQVIWTAHLKPLMLGMMDSVQSNVMNAGGKIIQTIESEHGLEIDDELINGHLRTALGNVTRGGEELVRSVLGSPEDTGA